MHARTTDRYGRMAAVCSVAGLDLGERLVQHGLAVDYTYYSKGLYRQAEAEARSRMADLWIGSFVEPRRFRDCMKGLGEIRGCSSS